MKIFAFPQFKKIASEISKAKKINLASFSLRRFSNQEMYLKINAKVNNETCLVLGSIAPPDENLIAFMLLCHTLKKENAKKVIAILPFLSYMRHEENEPQKSLATAWIGSLFKISGIDEIFTLDIHSIFAQKLMQTPTISLSSAPIFAQELNKLKLKNFSLLAPDKGAIQRCEMLKKAFQKNLLVAYMEKKRTNAIEHTKLVGKFEKNIIIVDDVLDTGKTLVSCCQKLKEKNINNIYIAVTHGLFIGNLWKKLWKLNVKKIYYTDTNPALTLKEKNIIKLSISQFLTNQLANNKII